MTNQWLITYGLDQPTLDRIDRLLDYLQQADKLNALVDALHRSQAALQTALNQNPLPAQAKAAEDFSALWSKQHEVKDMPAPLDALQAQVTATVGAEASAVTLMNGLSALLAASKNDPVAIQAIADQLKSSADALTAAVLANQPPP